MSTPHQRQRVSFATTIKNIEDLNPSFAIGRMRIAYTGDNHNGSSISREVIEDAIPTMFNCPIVANYDRATNSFGSHDVELVLQNRKMKLVNVTQPVGVLPVGAAFDFETDTDENGVEHEYLWADVILWKRQEAYEHILELGKVDESMECVFEKHHTDDRGYLVADKMYFEAFCLLESAAPCYEGASVEVFNEDNALKFKQQYAQMMSELAKYAASEDAADQRKEGGEDMRLEDTVIAEILKEFSIEPEQFTLEISDETTEDDVRNWASTFASENAAPAADAADEDTPETEGEPEEDAPADEAEEDPAPDDAQFAADTEGEPQSVSFSATYNQKCEAICNALPCFSDGNTEVVFYLCDFDDTHAFVSRWIWSGECPEGQCDHGRFSYTFNEDDKTAEITSEFEPMVVTWLTEEEYAALEQRRALLDELVAFRDETIQKTYEESLQGLFAEFRDLESVPEFNEYVNSTMELSGDADARPALDVVREHCFSIRGTQVRPFNEKLKEDAPARVSVAAPATSTENHSAFGALFEKFAKH